MKDRIEIVKADITDIEEISRLYDDVCDYLCEHKNYPGGKREYIQTKMTQKMDLMRVPYTLQKIITRLSAL